MACTAAPAGRGAGSGAALTPRGIESFDTAWATIRDHHYDQSMGGLDWNAVRDDLRPRAAAARTDAQLRAVIGEMLARLGESHYALLPGEVVDATAGAADPEAGGGSVGLELRVVDGVVLVTSVRVGGGAESAGVRPGWVVERVGDVTAAELYRRLERRSVGLGIRELEIELWRSLSSRLLGPAGGTVSVVFRDERDRRVPLRLRLDPQSGEPVRLGHLPVLMTTLEDERLPTSGRGVGVIRFNVWMAPVARAFDEAIDRHRDADGIVLDLRGNPGGLGGLVMGVGGHFFEEPLPLGVLVRRGAELRFAVNPRRIGSRNQPVTPYGGPVAILVDRHSASTTEILAGGMQAHGRARLFGERTAGQALPSLFTRLPNGDVLQYVIADLTLPGGARIEGRGIEPDVPVAIDRRELLAGRDPVMAAAVEWILSRAFASSPVAAGSRGARAPRRLVRTTTD
jgi:carboxyl-terminal processing protease